MISVSYLTGVYIFCILFATGRQANRLKPTVRDSIYFYGMNNKIRLITHAKFNQCECFANSTSDSVILIWIAICLLSLSIKRGYSTLYDNHSPILPSQNQNDHYHPKRRSSIIISRIAKNENYFKVSPPYSHLQVSEEKISRPSIRPIRSSSNRLVPVP